MTATAGGGRLDHLDALRGFALLGIALMNVEYFGAPLSQMGGGVQPGQGVLDAAADWLVYLLVQGKFWTLFSLLFGMGFVLMLERARTAGTRFAPVYLRRIAGLLVIGLAHAWFIWAGDILVSYALGALGLLLFFREAGTATLGVMGLVLWSVWATLMLAGGGLLVLAEQAGPEVAGGVLESLEGMRLQEIAAYAHGSWLEATAQRVHYWTAMAGNLVVMLPGLLGTFLVGGWMLRSGLAADPAAHRPALLRLVAIGLAGGLVLTLASLAVDPVPGQAASVGTGMVAAVLHMAAGLPAGLAYAGIVLLLAARPRSLLGVLAPAGRMALSNYLLQSLVGTWIFYGHGLGMWGGVGRAGQVLGVVVFFTLQVLASRWWLARFRQGPVEWLWRAFTWWRLPPLRQVPA
ncbi:DUF418 domain-containing protein [Lysobacter sp. GX 14042]|uniref:DUF418 domain-containing protein n=1 Tax=Lysobacter sp. GX 14042 TaxID=2907155 RepID=UPI001F225773|nr:DUF418 domain-containing protein [Lysobacter sp. GX 14042]MCE7032595.1 DUF418 domain-containing protein [Lysobacter sp. GX 14042]